MGQGTANASFYFDNAYLELLCERDANELESPVVKKLGLGERVHWHRSGACPFGVALRSAEPFQPGELDTWEYPAPFLPEGVTIPIITPARSIREPLVFISVMGVAPASYARERGIPLEHGGSRRILDRVNIAIPQDRVSSNLMRVSSAGCLEIRTGSPAYGMQLEFGGAPKEMLDFRPDLPLSITWAISPLR